MADFFLNKIYIDINAATTAYHLFSYSGKFVIMNCRVYRKSYTYKQGVELMPEWKELYRILFSLFDDQRHIFQENRPDDDLFLPLSLFENLYQFLTRKGFMLNVSNNVTKNFRIEHKGMSSNEYQKFLKELEVFVKNSKIENRFDIEIESDPNKFFENSKSLQTNFRVKISPTTYPDMFAITPGVFTGLKGRDLWRSTEHACEAFRKILIGDDDYLNNKMYQSKNKTIYCRQIDKNKLIKYLTGIGFNVEREGEDLELIYTYEKFDDFLNILSRIEKYKDVNRFESEQESDANKFFEHIKGFENFNTDKQINQFLKELEHYQSNHYGSYDRGKLVQAYQNLPQEFKNSIQPDTLKNLYRGCDGLSYREAISFTNKNWSAFYGHYSIPFEELESYDGLIDTVKVVNYLEENNLEYEIGDDEGEIIVIEPKWKSNLESKLKDYVV